MQAHQGEVLIRRRAPEGTGSQGYAACYVYNIYMACTFNVSSTPQSILTCLVVLQVWTSRLCCAANRRQQTEKHSRGDSMVCTLLHIAAGAGADLPCMCLLERLSMFRQSSRTAAE